MDQPATKFPKAPENIAARFMGRIFEILRWALMLCKAQMKEVVQSSAQLFILLKHVFSGFSFLDLT